MNDGKINVVFPEGFNQSFFELVIREGKSMELFSPLPVVRKFQSSVQTLFKIPVGSESNPFLLVNGYELKFFTDLDLNCSHEITAVIELSDEVKAYKINTNQSFSRAEITALIRKFAYTMEPSQVKNLILCMQNFKAVIETSVEDTDDKSGNTNKSVSRKLNVLTDQMPKSIFIIVPIFKNEEAKEMVLDVEVELKGTEIYFTFWSSEFSVLEKQSYNCIIDDVSKKAEKLKIPFILNK